LEVDGSGIVRNHHAFCVYVFEIAACVLNGMTILGFLFARLKQSLPGQTGVTKEISFGLIGWLFMELIFFPVIGLGPFALWVGLGIAPAMLSLGMVLTYSIVLGIVYVALDSRSH
jgi:hypothetical protein